MAERAREGGERVEEGRYMADDSRDAQLPTDLEFQVNKNGEIKQSIGNCVLAISHDPNLNGKIKYNNLTNKIDIIGKFIGVS